MFWGKCSYKRLKHSDLFPPKKARKRKINPEEKKAEGEKSRINERESIQKVSKTKNSCFGKGQ